MRRGNWLSLEPRLATRGPAIQLVASLARALSKVDPVAEGGITAINSLRRAYLEKALTLDSDTQNSRVCVSVLCDLRAQGWGFREREGNVQIHVPVKAPDPSEEKARVRAGLVIERDQQLCQPAVRRFVRDMERRRLSPNGEWVSVYSLMRDGRDLGQRLSRIDEASEASARMSELEQIIKPYIQFVDDTPCPHTGISLKEIWRYFRYTWSSPHKAVPGRSMWILIRDAAAPNHPVIGIAALGSAVVQLRIRDEWIGWTKEAFIGRLTANPTQAWAAWIAQAVRDQVGGVYAKDLIDEGTISAQDIVHPSPDVVIALRRRARAARKAHQMYGTSSEHKQVESNARRINWNDRARTKLFVAKRAETLADLLEDKLALKHSGFVRATVPSLRRALGNPGARKAIVRILRRVKASHVGIDMLDITVCGAVPPYSHLLGGKLVSLILTSPEVREAYHARYAQRASVIASAMAGRSVTRKPQLVLLGTTSLYGIGSSQYSRLRMPAERAGGTPGNEIRYVERGITEGYGSLHFSSGTLIEIRRLFAELTNGRRVKHIFGEGANPRLREVREALDQVGLPSDRLLKHDSSRIVYAVPLASNFREILLQVEQLPNYLLPNDDTEQRTRDIVMFWMQRWLLGRISSEQVLQNLATHSVAHPVTHGARVRLPDVPDEAPLFVHHLDQ
jgi:hypothetical protein